ncbi:hypothetical protein ACIGN6_31400 [Streptomyces sp. NPDC053792]|uniref:hypothetical protein n=1 Tax=Streptomyces sp. NPDC053792 TaxID=3365716 RepID=UPI0037D96433
MNFSLTRGQQDILTATRGALDAFTRTPRHRPAVLALTVALTEQSAHIIRRSDAESDVWTSAYWVTVDALEILGKARDHITPEFLTVAVRRDVVRAVDAFERAARTAGPAPLPHDEHGRYAPAPGTEYPFTIPDVARAAVRLLGPGWHAESGYMGTTGQITGPDGTVYVLAVGNVGDADDELYVRCDDEVTELLDAGGEGLETLAERVAGGIREVPSEWG